MVGRIFITRTGYDPQRGRHIKDPYLSDTPSLGACRPDIRRRLAPGDHVFVISGKVPDANQFVIGGFEVESKIDMREAYRLFPEQRLRRRDDGQLAGNIIVNSKGGQHRRIFIRYSFSCGEFRRAVPGDQVETRPGHPECGNHIPRLWLPT